MNGEQARIILKFHRPDRPRNTERRQLQQAIDVILGEETKPKGEWLKTNDNVLYECSVCGRKINCLPSQTKYYPFCHCGADMR